MKEKEILRNVSIRSAGFHKDYKNGSSDFMPASHMPLKRYGMA